MASSDGHIQGTSELRTVFATAGRLGGAALPAVQVLVLMVQGETGHLALQVSKLWLHRHIGTEEEATQNIPTHKYH